MYRIALCEDEDLLASKYEVQIENYFSRTSLNAEIDIFNSGERLINYIEKQHEQYQIIFLDIEMEGINGIEAARKIRKKNKNVLICYLTSYSEYTLESFEVSPFRYLLKPLDEKKLETTLDAAIEEIELECNYLFVKIGKTQRQLPQSMIAVIKSELGRKLTIIMDNGEEISFYGKLAAIKEKLNHLYFIKVNQGTIINMGYIDRIEDDLIIMNTNDFISVSRRQKKEFRNAYNRFIERWTGMQ